MFVLNDVKKTQLVKLKKLGFKLVVPTNKYEAYRLKGITTLILYNTGKLVVAGSEDNIKKTKTILRKNGIKIPVERTRKSSGNKHSKTHKPETRKKSVKEQHFKRAPNAGTMSGIYVGSDESLKGDTFGGIVVCAFRANDEERAKLKKIGVRDSKKLNNAEISCLAGDLSVEFPKNYHVENIFPDEFNKMNKKANLTRILDELHKRCYTKVKKPGSKHIVDKYPGCRIGDYAVPQAESRYPEVAAASIMARFEALKQIRQLEMEAGFFLPMGSTHVEDALMEIKRKCLDPKRLVKMSFSNVKEMFSKPCFDK